MPRRACVLAAMVALSWLLRTAAAHAEPRRPAELFVDLGFGNAVCDNKKPDSDCPVDGAGTFGFGGAWRFHPNWAVGGELGIWAFKVKDAWRGQLQGQNPATDVKLSSVFIAPLARWYWDPGGIADPYLQAGVGLGAVTAKASNAGGTYDAQATGVVFPVGIGVDWYLSRYFRLGPQALAYLQYTSKVCETTNGDKTCHGPSSDNNALPWRIAVVGTFVIGGRSETAASR
ncbi:MAG: hypothetical protein HY898_20060 [Deltaproteobacteria bacterium]|nr:hypothetical protein [Deltaproteobacteria bacterium]